MHPRHQADSGIHEDPLLSFLVNRLGEELSISNNAETTTEDPCPNVVCFKHERRAAHTILDHLRTKFKPERLEQIANMLLRWDLDELLPEQVEVCADLYLQPYYGVKDETIGPYHS